MDFNSWEKLMDRSDKTAYTPVSNEANKICDRLKNLYVGMEKAKMQALKEHKQMF